MVYVIKTISIQGISELISENPDSFVEITQGCEASESDVSESAQAAPICRKEDGRMYKLKKMSRGILIIVSGSGIIQYWAPLYR